MNSKRLILSFFVVLSLLVAPFTGGNSIVTAAPLAAPTCHSSSPTSGAYIVSLCFTTPAAGATLTGNTTVTATVTVTGTNPGVQRMIFYLNSLYQLTDYQSPYTFTLPTAKWVDGTYSLSVGALMRDAFTSQQTILPVTFSNGITTPPVNTNTFHPSTGLPANGSPFVVVAVGDGASGETNAVNVSNLIGSLNPNLLLYLGDVYEKGSPLEFFNWYGAQTNNFGTYKAITNPTIGNHEYSNSASAAGYFDYWDNIPNYYSYNAGGWHFISLNSNRTRVAIDPTSAQYQWLQQDLTANSQACKIVYYHHPLFNIGPEGSTSQLSDIWSLLAQSGVEIVINGHDHTYQRWVPLNGSGQPSTTGITEFVAGASGHGLQTIGTSDSRVAYSIDTNPTAFGALKFVLNSNGASFQYVNTSGTILDSGTIPCTTSGADTQAPTIPTGVTATSPSHYQVNLSWSASSDNVGVSGYRISRNGSVLVSVPGSSLSYLDSTVSPSTQYTYRVDAFDQAGNHSAASNPAVVTTLSMPASLTYPPVADTYVSASSPTTNYGTATTFRVDASPDLHSYLRFQVQGTLGVPITRATLRIYTNTTSAIGVQALGVSNTTWGETTTNYSNAPALGSLLASSGAVTANTWVSLNITPYITGDGTYSFGVQTTSSSAMSFPSKEATTNKPQLLLEFSPVSDTQAPGTPGGVNAAAAGSTQINLSWTASTDNVGVTGYSIFRNAALVTTVPSSSLSFQDINLTPSTTYSYTLDAFDLAGNHSALSAPVNATTTALTDTQAPSVPTGVLATSPSHNQVNLSWSASSDNVGVSGYRISRNGSVLVSVPGSSLSYLDSTVSPSTQYSYTVDAFDQAGNHSAASNPAVVTTLSMPASLTYPPVADTYVSASSPTTNYGTTTTFRVDGSPDLHSYLRFQVQGTLGVPITRATLRIYTNTTSAIGVQALGVSNTTWGETTTNYSNAPALGSLLASSGAVTANTWVSLNITPYITGDGTYSFGVQTTSSSAMSFPSKEATTNKPQLLLEFGPISDTQAPGTPGGVNAAAAGSTQINLSWSASTDNVGVTGYSIFRNTALVTTVPSSSLSFQDINLTPSTTYSYTLDAFDLAGNHSALSAPVNATTTALTDTQAPSVPANVNGAATGTPQVNLTWSASTDNIGVTGYTIYRGGVSLTTVTGSTLSYTDLAVSPSTNYVYTIDAFDLASNHSAVSAPVNVITPALSDTQAPSIPLGVGAISPNPNQVDLVWNASTDNVGVTGYTIYRNGANLITVPGTAHTYSDTTVSPSTSYAYTLDAYDLAGNHSAVSTAANITTGSLPDTQAPTVPTGLNAVSSSPTKVDLTWGAASDNVGVTGYTIYRDGSSLTTVSGSTLTFSDTTVAPATVYSYTLDAFDQAGNHSAVTGPATVTTQSLAASLTFGPVADTYVSATNPTINYGTATTLRTDGSPDLHGYLRFNVQGIAGRTISKVTLKLYANSSSNQGIQILAVSDNTWVETAVNYNTAPALGSALNTPTAFPTGAYVSFDITGYITADGIYNLGFLTPSATAISLQSREAASNNPQLILEFN